MPSFHQNGTEKKNEGVVKIIRQLLAAIWVFLVVLIILFVAVVFGIPNFKKNKTTNQPIPSVTSSEPKSDFWQAPDSASIDDEEVKYGRQLVAHTSEFLGPNGSVMHITNGMNCQNCHLDAGTKVFGNNYSAVASTYPKFRTRSGSIETIEKRVNDCIERSLNGKALDTASKEMKAFVAYIKWVGKDVPKGESPKGVGLWDIPLMGHAADPKKGQAIYDTKCQSCHQKNGQGLPDSVRHAYIYPPLWGEHSYNTGAGLFRLSRFAGYVKANMPFGASHENMQLTDEEAWDVAAFVNSQPRPVRDLKKDWPDVSKKPFDHPFGPYTDGFSEEQHKYGPFGPIKAAAKK